MKRDAGEHMAVVRVARTEMRSGNPGVNGPSRSRGNNTIASRTFFAAARAL